jgi:hypothetical protein
MSFSWASPESLEVVFLSRPQISSLINILDSQPQLIGRFVQNDYECIPMGGGCFHPQLGIIEDPSKKAKPVVKERPTQTKTINSAGTDLISCDEGNYFDIFCGRAKKEKVEKSDFEIWIDTSSSLKQVDYSPDLKFCERRRLMSKVLEDCRGKVTVKTFDSNIRELGGLETLCLSKGMNDGKRMVQWLKESEAKKVIIITDVDEYVEEFREYLDLVNAKIVGIGTKFIQGTDLYGAYANKMIKICK